MTSTKKIARLNQDNYSEWNPPRFILDFAALLLNYSSAHEARDKYLYVNVRSRALMDAQATADRADEPTCACAVVIKLPWLGRTSRAAEESFLSPYFEAPCTPDLATATPPASISIPRRSAVAQSDSPAGKQAAVRGDIGLKSNHSSAQSQYCFSARFCFPFSLARTVLHACERRWDGEYWARCLTALAALSFVGFFFGPGVLFFIWVNWGKNESMQVLIVF